MTKSTMANNFMHKFKKQSLFVRIIFLLVGLIYFVSLLFFTKSILLLTGIETLIRILILAGLYIYLILYFFLGIILLFTGRKKRFASMVILAFILSPVLIIGSYYIDKTYGILDGTQKKYVNYKSYLVCLNGTNEYQKVGMISDEKDPTGYIIPQEMIKKNKLDFEIIKYDDYISMMSDLYDGKIDALFIADNYVTMFKNYENFEKIDEETKVVYELGKELKNIDNVATTTKDLTEPFSMLLMGVDATEEGIASSSSFNGDTLMLVTFNPNTLSATIFSIPRDTYVPIACRGNEEDKINSSAYGGTTCVINTIQNLTGIDIDYYLKINFTGVVSLVDDVGGIEVDVPVSFCEQDSQRRFGEHLICLEPGLQKLNGEQALALSRHRHSLPLGDFQRVQHQQLVVEAMVKEIKNIRNLDDFYKILDDVAKNIDTNLTTSQILSFYNVGKNVLLNKVGDDAQLSIQKTYLTGYDLTMYIPKYRSYIYTFQYYKQSLDEIVEAMKINLGLIEPTLTKTFAFDANEEYEAVVAGKKYYSEDRRTLMPNLVGQSRAFVEAWASDNGVSLTVNEVTSGDSGYDDNLSDGYVLTQSVGQGTLMENVNNLSISVIKKTETKKEEIKPEEKTTEETKKEDTDKKQAEKPKEEETETIIPDFTGKSISEFNKWKNSLQNANTVFYTEQLNADDILGLSVTTLEDNIIYKQSHTKGTKLSGISTFTVYYYKKPVETSNEEPQENEENTEPNEEQEN